MAQDKTKIVMGTATPGGGFPAYGWLYAEALNRADPTLAIEPINTKGSNENVVALDEGRLDIGLVTGEVTYEAISGLGRPKAGNLRIINATADKMGVPRDRVVTTVHRQGNTSAASVPLALDTAVRDGRIKPGQLVLLEGVGGGMTWGSVLLRW